MLSNTINIGSIVKVNRLTKKILQNFGLCLCSAVVLLNNAARWCNTGVPNLSTITYHLGTPYCQRVPLLPEQLI